MTETSCLSVKAFILYNLSSPSSDSMFYRNNNAMPFSQFSKILEQKKAKKINWFTAFLLFSDAKKLKYTNINMEPKRAPGKSRCC